MNIEQQRQKEAELTGGKLSESGGAQLEGNDSGEKGKSPEQANSDANNVLSGGHLEGGHDYRKEMSKERNIENASNDGVKVVDDKNN